MSNEAMYAYNFEGRRYDVGDKQGFLEASIEFALKRDDLRRNFMRYLVTVKDNPLFKDLYDEIINESN
jgi:UTP--glucose-1-phosphate uridylyltransferase